MRSATTQSARNFHCTWVWLQCLVQSSVGSHTLSRTVPEILMNDRLECVDSSACSANVGSKFAADVRPVSCWTRGLPGLCCQTRSEGCNLSLLCWLQSEPRKKSYQEVSSSAWWPRKTRNLPSLISDKRRFISRNLALFSFGLLRSYGKESPGTNNSTFKNFLRNFSTFKLPDNLSKRKNYFRKQTLHIVLKTTFSLLHWLHAQENKKYYFEPHNWNFFGRNGTNFASTK